MAREGLPCIGCTHGFTHTLYTHMGGTQQRKINQLKQQNLNTSTTREHRVVGHVANKTVHTGTGMCMCSMYTFKQLEAEAGTGQMMATYSFQPMMSTCSPPHLEPVGAVEGFHVALVRPRRPVWESDVHFLAHHLG